MFRPTPDGPGNLQVCRTLIFEPEKTVPVRPSASLQNRVYLTTIDAFLRKFAMRCGAATLPDPTPPQVQRLRESLHLWWSQNSVHNSAQRLHEGFFVACRPPLVPKFRTAPVRRLFCVASRPTSDPTRCNSGQRLYLTTSGKGSARVEQSRAKGDGNSAKSTHRAYLTTSGVNFLDDPGCSM